MESRTDGQILLGAAALVRLKFSITLIGNYLNIARGRRFVAGDTQTQFCVVVRVSTWVEDGDKNERRMHQGHGGTDSQSKPATGVYGRATLW